MTLCVIRETIYERGGWSGHRGLCGFGGQCDRDGLRHPVHAEKCQLGPDQRDRRPSALKVAREQLAIEQARRYKDMEERGEPALEGRVVASPDDDGTGRARLEIQLMNAVELTSMVVIFRSGCPVNPYAATRVMSENRRPFPDGGNIVIKMGFPAHWRVYDVGDVQPFTLEVMARGDYGKSWDSLRVRVTFDDWTPPAVPRQSVL
jgi:hypothetical protein